MAYPHYLRERARQLRTEKHLSLIEIADRLALPKTTVYYWIKDLPLERPRRNSSTKASRAMQAKYRRLREDAGGRGFTEYEELIKLPTFRDFVVLYIAEGYKRNRNTVQICNSDPAVVAMAAGWLTSLGARKLLYSVQYHADQDLEKLQNYWGDLLAVDPAAISTLRKSNSGELNRRQWRSAYGVLAMRTFDTYLRARLQAWIDQVRQDWRLDSAPSYGA